MERVSAGAFYLSECFQHYIAYCSLLCFDRSRAVSCAANKKRLKLMQKLFADGTFVARPLDLDRGKGGLVIVLIQLC